MKHPLQQARVRADAPPATTQLPPPGPPEIAFAGRSNAGKSSAINALANRTRLAFTSKTPGRTQQINFFALRSGALLADLPGYGYAAVPQALKRHWQEFLARYLATRQSLVGLVLVVDARHGLADSTGAARRLSAERAAGAGPRDQDGQAHAVGAARGATRRSTRDRRRVSGARGATSRSCRSRRRRGIGVEAAEAVLAGWLGIDASAERSPSSDSRKRKGPAIKGSDAGPETPGIGMNHTRAPAQGGKRETFTVC